MRLSVYNIIGTVFLLNVSYYYYCLVLCLNCKETVWLKYILVFSFLENVQSGTIRKLS